MTNKNDRLVDDVAFILEECILRTVARADAAWTALASADESCKMDERLARAKYRRICDDQEHAR